MRGCGIHISLMISLVSCFTATEKTWKVIEEAINEIHNQNASGLSFEELYRNAYNMVLHKFGERLYSGTRKAITDHLKSIAAKVEGSGQGPGFLRELKKRWDDHIKSTQMVRDILMYMDRCVDHSMHHSLLLTLPLYCQDVCHDSK